MRRSLALGGLLVLFGCLPAGAQPTPAPQGPIVIGVSSFAPFVEESDGELSGFDVELWKAIAEELRWEYRFESRPTLQQLLADTRAGKTQAALAGITITAEREAGVDFSHQYIRSGLQVLAPTDAELGPLGVVRQLVSGASLLWLGGGLAFILGSALICWWSERGEEAFDDAFFPGFFEAIYWTIVTMSTVGYGDYAPKRWLGRCVAILVIFSGVSLYGTLVAQSAALFSSAEHAIQGPEDLRGRRVAVVEESTSAESARGFGARVREYPTIEACYAAMRAGAVDAVIADAPTLRHYVHGKGAGQGVLAGRVFADQYYGVAFPEGSALREPVNRALLKLQVNGIYDRLYARYFGG